MARNFIWRCETQQPELGTVSNVSGEIDLRTGFTLSAVDPISGTKSGLVANSIFAQAEAFNDTANEEFANVDHGTALFKFEVNSTPGWTDNCMLLQVGDKHEDSSPDTNSAIQVLMSSVGGAQDNGIAYRWGPNGSFTSIESQFLDLALDSIHEIEIEWDAAGGIGGNKYLTMKVNGELQAFYDQSITSMPFSVFTNINFANDTTDTAAFKVDDFEFDDAITTPAPPSFTGKEIFIAFNDANPAANTFKTWNSLLSQSQSIADLQDSTGALTGISWTPGAISANDRTGGRTETGTVDLEWMDESIVMSEYHQILGNSQYTIGGLNPDKLYAIDVCGVYNSTTVRGEFTVDDYATSQVQVFRYLDATKIPAASFEDIVPDGSGEISFQVRPYTGFSNASLNGMRIREYDAPSPPSSGSGLVRSLVRPATRTIIRDVIR